MSTLALPCNHPGCNKPWLHIHNGLLIVESRHSGHQHINSCTLSQMVGLLRATTGRVSEASLSAILPDDLEPVELVMEEETVWAAPLRCYRAACRLPWGYVYNGILAVDSYHDFEKHRNQITLPMLGRLMGGQVNARPWRGWSVKA